jgi:gluconate 2-dehydrogenase gamma chain
MIDRRASLAGIVTMFGASLFAPLARVAAADLSTISDGPPSAAVFTAAQRALLTALSERIIPTTDTPGAIAAGVPAYIEKLLADWALPVDADVVTEGLDRLDAVAQAEFGTSLVKAGAERQDALLTRAMSDMLPGGRAFFEALRQMVIAGYYTSDVGMTEERNYLPLPGRYDGAYPMKNVTRVFSS